jgi:hypothetical protein
MPDYDVHEADYYEDSKLIQINVSFDMSANFLSSLLPIRSIAPLRILQLLQQQLQPSRPLLVPLLNLQPMQSAPVPSIPLQAMEMRLISRISNSPTTQLLQAANVARSTRTPEASLGTSSPSPTFLPAAISTSILARTVALMIMAVRSRLASTMARDHATIFAM